MKRVADPAVTRWVQGGFVAASLTLAGFQASHLLPRWREWQAGVPDAYAGQHRSLFFGALAGLLLALVIPIPLLLPRNGPAHRRRRSALLAVWGVLMAGTVVSLLLVGRG